MKKMKGIVAAVLALAALSAMTTSAFAAELNQDTPSGEAVVVYQAGQKTSDNDTPDDPTDDVMGGTYTVTIPEYIVAADVDGDPTEEDVTATDVLIPYGTNLTVTVSYADTLTLQDNEGATVAYQMQKDGSAISSGDTILTVPAGDPDGSTTAKLGAVLTAEPDYAGVYLDTATFNVAVA